MHLLATAALLFAAPTWARPVPAAPQYYVLDEAEALPPRLLHALQSVLIEHDRATGERFMVALVKDAGDDGVAAFAERAASDWRVSILLALDLREREGAIQAGFAPEEDWIRSHARPELDAGKPDRAAILTTLEILRSIESPLIQSGKAHEIFRSGGFKGSWQPRSDSIGASEWSAWLVAGLILLGWVLNWLIAAEAHYTGKGWFRPRPRVRPSWAKPKRRKDPATETGGAHGSW